MGRRSRRREAAGEHETRPAEVPPAGSTRAQRDAARRRRRAGGEEDGPRRALHPTEERPKPPWGNFPLSELVILLALIFLVAGFFVSGTRGATMLGAGLVLGSLAALELTIREHFAGFRSHTTLLAGAAATVVLIGSLFALRAVGVDSALAVLGIALVLAGGVFAVVFQALRQAFIRRSGGLGFR